MKCGNCSVDIGLEFTFAISKNICPACGEQIMSPERLASLVSLKSLLSTNFRSSDVDKISNLVISNFEIRQLFKEEPKLEEQSPRQEARAELTQETVEEVEEEVQAEDEDTIFKKRQQEEARAILKKMKEEALDGEDEPDVREEAFTEALAERLGNANGLMMEDETPIESAVRAKREFEMEQQRRNVVSGSKGAFRRST